MATASVSFNSPLLSQLASRLATCPSLPPQPAAVLVVLTNEAQPKLLYTRRAAHLHHHAGEVGFLGGKREATDADNVATALREAHEEAGMCPHQVSILGCLPMQATHQGIAVAPVVGLVAADVVLTAQADEVARLFWVDLAGLIALPTCPYRYQRGKQTVISPSFVVDGEVIWGLTGRITASLLELGFDRQIEWTYYFDLTSR